MILISYDSPPLYALLSLIIHFQTYLFTGAVIETPQDEMPICVQSLTLADENGNPFTIDPDNVDLFSFYLKQLKEQVLLCKSSFLHTSTC